MVPILKAEATLKSSDHKKVPFVHLSCCLRPFRSLSFDGSFRILIERLLLPQVPARTPCPRNVVEPSDSTVSSRVMQEKHVSLVEYISRYMRS